MCDLVHFRQFRVITRLSVFLLYTRLLLQCTERCYYAPDVGGWAREAGPEYRDFGQIYLFYFIYFINP